MVIQRIQSLYLLLVAVLVDTFAFLPVFDIIADSGNLTVGALPVGSITTLSWPLLCLDALTAVMAVITIFKYRDLKFQTRLAGVVIALIVALLVTIAVLFVGQRGHGIAVMRLTVALPFVALVLAMLARKGIKSDRRLLSDSERIR